MTRIHPTNISIHTCRDRVVDLLLFDLELRHYTRQAGELVVQNGAGAGIAAVLGLNPHCEGEGGREGLRKSSLVNRSAWFMILLGHLQPKRAF